MKHVVFLGDNLGMMETEAEEYLRSTFPEVDLKSTDDIHRVTIPYGAGMDDVRTLTQAEYLPMDLPVSVIVIRNVERLPDSAQGAFLTELERDDRLYLFLAQCPMIETVESRCEVRQVLDLTEYGDENWREAIGYSEDGLPENEERMLHEFTDALFVHGPYEALKALHMYGEKEPESFYNLYKDDCWRVFRCCRVFETLVLFRESDPFRILAAKEKEQKALRQIPTQNAFLADLMELL